MEISTKFPAERIIPTGIMARFQVTFDIEDFYGISIAVVMGLSIALAVHSFDPTLQMYKVELSAFNKEFDYSFFRFSVSSQSFSTKLASGSPTTLK